MPCACAFGGRIALTQIRLSPSGKRLGSVVADHWRVTSPLYLSVQAAAIHNLAPSVSPEGSLLASLDYSFWERF